MSKALTKNQLMILQWLRDFPSTKAGWRRGSKAAFGKPETWTAMLISGSRGSLLIDTPDWVALRGMIIGCPTPDKIYGPNEAGITALKIGTA